MNFENVTILLRRDLEKNYDLVSNSFIPGKGEVCFVDSASKGLLMKVGDGIHSYGNLPFLIGGGSGIVLAYYKDGLFYEDTLGTIPIVGNGDSIYIDLNTDTPYYYSDVYKPIINYTPLATPKVAGVLKLFDSLGENVDGTVSQKIITQELGKKFVVNIDESRESIEFTK